METIKILSATCNIYGTTWSLMKPFPYFEIYTRTTHNKIFQDTVFFVWENRLGHIKDKRQDVRSYKRSFS